MFVALDDRIFIVNNFIAHSKVVTGTDDGVGESKKLGRRRKTIVVHLEDGEKLEALPYCPPPSYFAVIMTLLRGLLWILAIFFISSVSGGLGSSEAQ